MNENGSKSPKINGIIKIEISQLYIGAENERKWIEKMDESKSKSLKIIQNLPKWGKIVQSLPK